MKCGPATSNSRDLLSHPLPGFTWFCLPAIAIVATGHHGVGAGWRTAVWTASLGIIGTACLANAVRCGRVHCYITGPFFLVMAVVTLLYGLGVLRLGGNAWNVIGLTILVGAIALSCLPEMFFGKYRRDRARIADHR
jgi:uncharacterized membrane protein HdeD (DUF308 family)